MLRFNRRQFLQAGALAATGTLSPFADAAPQQVPHSGGNEAGHAVPGPTVINGHSQLPKLGKNDRFPAQGIVIPWGTSVSVAVLFTLPSGLDYKPRVRFDIQYGRQSYVTRVFEAAESKGFDSDGATLQAHDFRAPVDFGAGRQYERVVLISSLSVDDGPNGNGPVADLLYGPNSSHAKSYKTDVPNLMATMKVGEVDFSNGTSPGLATVLVFGTW